mgnify:CR=1 FL=1
MAAFATGKRAGSRAYRPRKMRFTARKARAINKMRSRRRRAIGNRVTLKTQYFPNVRALKKSLLTKNVLNAISSRSASTSPESALAFLAGMNQKTSVTGTRGGAKLTATSTNFMQSPGAGAGDREVPVMSATTSQTMRQTGLGKGDRRIYRTNITSGRLTARAIIEQGKLQGEHTEVLLDTKQPFSEENNIIPDRQALDEFHGFNQRAVQVLPMGATVTSRQVFNKMFDIQYVNEGPISNRVSDRSAKDLAYIGVKHSKSTMTIMNKNQFLPINLRFHIMSRKGGDENGDAPNRLFVERVFNDTSNLQDFGRIPERYQIFGRTTKSDDTTASLLKRWIFQSWRILCSNKFTFRSSAEFREKFEIVDSWNMRLQPNDQWVINHKHMFGSGIDFYSASREMQINDSTDYTDASSGYFYVIESWGPPVLAEIADAVGPVTTQTYQGSAPGQYHLEYKTSVTSVNSTGNEFRLETGAEGSDPSMLVRIFKRSDYINEPSEREVNVSYTNIVPSAADITSVGEAFVPLITDLDVRGAGPRS